MIKKSVLAFIRMYQAIISPIKPATCRFYPTCSTYCQEAITHYGVFRGSILSIKRLLSCHPFHPGGIQELPKNFLFREKA